MAQVDFYILETPGNDAREFFACKLVEKARQSSRHVHLRVAGSDALQHLDALLWTYSEASFVAHDVWPADDCMADVTLGMAADGLPQIADVCVNLAEDSAPDCARIAEIVAADDSNRQRGRQCYSDYRERGFELQTHHIGRRR